eukprot:CAMPEP_0174325426 /NCGR_PEP_ID=MMETSP0810-20121108/13240_1 /TAXON_ID=73025 ORGANISM="Eutreptiella gymnastica-like, Strain CCMP1594" /NCGR_SAMPLE_ID=MMETSP0810 /ASSEMBLY_ACC=CAM_ASM_000659 /LENGTH=212 /DNA_ID=CAMNT_0015438731 /DNA_START=215 /DNA_END=853 /DNA_ORIENTATION=+
MALKDVTTHYEGVKNLLDGFGKSPRDDMVSHAQQLNAVPTAGGVRMQPWGNGLAKLQEELQAKSQEFKLKSEEFRMDMQSRWGDFASNLPKFGQGKKAEEPAQEQLAEEKEASGLPTDWVCNSMYYESVRYTGIIWLPIRRNTDKEIECMSLNGKDCGWQKKEDECGEIISKYRDAKLKPLVCGEMHKKVWKETGYDVEGHWCQSGAKMIPL